VQDAAVSADVLVVGSGASFDLVLVKYQLAGSAGMKRVVLIDDDLLLTAHRRPGCESRRVRVVVTGADDEPEVRVDARRHGRVAPLASASVPS